MTSTKTLYKDYPVSPIGFSEVTLRDHFWAPRLKIQKKEMVPFALEKTVPAVENLRKTGEFLRGNQEDLPFSHRFISSDLYKVMEGAAYLLKNEKDERLEAQLDEIIDIIGRAQEDDGYLYVAHSCGISNKEEMGESKYSWVIHSHELYNIGHMIEGAVAYFEATGKRAWLDIAEKSAHHIQKVFFEGDPNYNGGVAIQQAPGHQELEMALCRLFRATGNELYLQMSKKFLDIRGVTYRPEGKGIMSPSYAQQHAPVSEQMEAVGHAVRAAYQYAAMADVSALEGDDAYLASLDGVWQDIVNKKMHITGGLGAIHGIEGFGEAFDLPNLEAYNETCAAIANVFFNHRMFLLHRDAKYFDVAEVSLFNNSLAGGNHEGNRFFYVNPLEADGHSLFNHGSAGRSPWFDCACCPSNLARIVNHVGGYMYSKGEAELYVMLYAESDTSFEADGREVKVQQRTRYPHDGDVLLDFSMDQATEFDLYLRIPTWTQGQFVPGSLYQYADGRGCAGYELLVNGEAVMPYVENGLVKIHRTWNSGDQVRLVLNMPIRFSNCDEQVRDNRKRLAVTRGPLVYCAEGVDNDGLVQRFFVNQDHLTAQLGPSVGDGLFDGVPSIEVASKEIKAGAISETKLKMIPYMDWNNRGNGSMIVWLPTSSQQTQEQLDRGAFDPSIYGEVSASSQSGEELPAAISDGQRPQDSRDLSIPRWTSKGGGEQWLEMRFSDAQTIERLGVFWAVDDEKKVEPPLSWKMEYHDGQTWQVFEKYITDVFGLQPDRYNTIHPSAELSCHGLRLIMTCRDERELGLLDIDLTIK